jgi:hypothetical protein
MELRDWRRIASSPARMPSIAECRVSGKTMGQNSKHGAFLREPQLHVISAGSGYKISFLM